MTLILIQTTVFSIFIYSIVKKFGVLTSISDSWYKLEEKNQGIFFTLFMWSLGLTTCFYDSTLFVLAGASLCFVGAATDFKEKTTDVVHYVGATGGISLALIALWVDRGLWFPLAGTLACVILSIIFKNKIKNKTWWVEIAAFTWIELGLLWNTLY